MVGQTEVTEDEQKEEKEKIEAAYNTHDDDKEKNMSRMSLKGRKFSKAKKLNIDIEKINY